MNEYEPTDQDLVTDHPFEPMPGYEHLCNYRGKDDDWPCGFGPPDHEQAGP